MASSPVEGPDQSGTPASRPPVQVSGTDSNGAVRRLRTTSTGVLQVAAGAAAALTPSAPAAATVGVSSAQAVAANSSRTGLVLINTSANTVSIAFGSPAVLDSGITLNPSGGTFEMDANTFTTAAVNAIASGATSNLAVQEYA